MAQTQLYEQEFTILYVTGGVRFSLKNFPEKMIAESGLPIDINLGATYSEHYTSES